MAAFGEIDEMSKFWPNGEMAKFWWNTRIKKENLIKLVKIKIK